MPCFLDFSALFCYNISSLFYKRLSKLTSAGRPHGVSFLLHFFRLLPFISYHPDCQVRAHHFSGQRQPIHNADQDILHFTDLLTSFRFLVSRFRRSHLVNMFIGIPSFYVHGTFGFRNNISFIPPAEEVPAPVGAAQAILHINTVSL